MNKRVGIIGSGMVAKQLALGFLRYGYDVMMGTRNHHKIEEWQKESAPGIKTGNFLNTAEYGELIIFAVKGAYG